MEPKVSIIVPVYKVENYLAQCIESIRSQSLRDIEIILVDDGSPDNCGKMCDGFAESDPRVKVIHKKNGGLSSARNAGLKIAKGEYIGFVDSDDYIAPEMFEKLYLTCIENNVLLSSCNYFYVFGEDIQYVNETEKTTVLTNEAFFKKILTEDDRIEMVAWNKLYHRSILEKFDEVFPEGKLFEDLGSMYKFVFSTDKIAYVDKGLYFYRRFRPGAITAGKFSSRELDRLEMGDKMTEYIRDKAPSIYEDALSFKFVNSYLSCVNSMVVSNFCDKKIYGYIRKDLRNNLKIILKCELPLWKKMQLTLCSISYKLYAVLFKISKRG